MNDRVTQAGSYVGAQANATNDVRMTQGGVYVGVLGAAEGVRATQAGVMVGAQANASNDMRLTQLGIYVGVRSERPDCLTNEADCWRIERADGVVFRYTSASRAITINNESYSPCASLNTSALQLSAEFGATENMDLSGVIAEAGITRSDLWAGRFDGAAVEVWRAAWDGSTTPKLIAAGNCGAVEFGSNGWTVEVTTAGARLQQRPILQPCMASCRYKLGDSRCGVDLPALSVAGAVTSVASADVFAGAERRIFTDTSRAEADDYFQLGRLTWTSGENTGLSVDVKSFAADQFVLEQAMQYNIEVGDTYSVVPGCDRLFTTCDVKFSNHENFGGFPHLRGTDDLARTPPNKTN